MTRSTSSTAGFSTNGHCINEIEPPPVTNNSQNHSTGLVKARTMSYTQKLIENGNNSASEEENSRKTSVKPNIKELTNKQRNWFSSFEKSRKESNGNEPIDSVRRSR